MALAARSWDVAASSSCASRLIAAGGVALGAEAHQAGVEGAPQAVGDDGVAQLGVAVAEPAAGAVGEVRARWSSTPCPPATTMSASPAAIIWSAR